jgi:hypothetical protein
MRKEYPDDWNLKLWAILLTQKWGLPFGDPHALSCILHDNQILLNYMYPVGIRYANQDLNVPDKAG